MNDYQRVARVIEYLDTHYQEQPNLEALASHVGLSQFHFHRLFSKWAGATPKDFLQCLTAARAKELLRRGESVLDAAHEVGLSGPGRLHDLCVTLEAASPGELKSGGEDFTIRFGAAPTPFGDWLVGEGPRGICHVAFFDENGLEAAVAQLRGEWPRASLVPDDGGGAQRLADSVFDDSDEPGARDPLRIFVRATPFQLRVWRALIRIPAGALVSYRALAAHAGNPKASRAVGTAVSQNSVAYLIPCHRVIRETGVIGNYRWGQTRKRAMIAWEDEGAPVIEDA